MASSQQKLGTFVSRPFRLCTKKFSTFKNHESCKYHQEALDKMATFKMTYVNSSLAVANMLDKEREEQISQNTSVIRSLFECVLFCGRQGLAFRGHRDDSRYFENDKLGNFLELVHFRAKTDKVLEKHLQNSPRNGVYTSKTILKSIVGEYIQKRLVNEIKSSKYYSILADEVRNTDNSFKIC